MEQGSTRPHARRGYQAVDRLADRDARAALNAPNSFAVRKDTQLILDASDADGRCHDNGTFDVWKVTLPAPPQPRY